MDTISKFDLLKEIERHNNHLLYSYNDLPNLLTGDKLSLEKVVIDGLKLVALSLTFASFVGCHFKGGSFTMSNLIRANFHNCTFDDWSFYSSSLNHSQFENCNFNASQFSECSFHQAQLISSKFVRTPFYNCSFSYASLYKSRFTDCHLPTSSFFDVDFNNVYLDVDSDPTKRMGVEPGNIYWKAIGPNLNNNDYTFKLGVNNLARCDKFADDDRKLCSYPGFHFASKPWVKTYYGWRPYLAKIRIPDDAIINEPFGTDGKASANKIEILSIYDMKTEEDITHQFE